MIPGEGARGGRDLMECAICGHDFDWTDDAQSVFHERFCGEIRDTGYPHITAEISERLRTHSPEEPEKRYVWYRCGCGSPDGEEFCRLHNEPEAPIVPFEVGEDAEWFREQLRIFAPEEERDDG